MRRRPRRGGRGRGADQRLVGEAAVDPLGAPDGQREQQRGATADADEGGRPERQLVEQPEQVVEVVVHRAGIGQAGARAVAPAGRDDDEVIGIEPVGQRLQRAGTESGRVQQHHGRARTGPLVADGLGHGSLWRVGRAEMEASGQAGERTAVGRTGRRAGVGISGGNCIPTHDLGQVRSGGGGARPTGSMQLAGDQLAGQRPDDALDEVVHLLDRRRSRASCRRRTSRCRPGPRPAR